MGGIDSNAIASDDIQCLITNFGTITGAIQFGAADDLYDGSQGRIAGAVRGADGNDTIVTGAGRDWIEGNAGSDSLEGGAGRDRFVYLAVSESGGDTHDTILGFDARKDKFDLTVNVTGIDPTEGGHLDDGGQFDNGLVTAIGAADLAAHHAVLFMPSTGDLAGHTILVVDVNGNAGYQKNKDYVFDLDDADNLGNLDIGDFI
jgi:Ca2+-binding RTX toxin-like protein